MNTTSIDKLKIIRPPDTPDDFVHGALWLRNEIKALPEQSDRLFGLIDPASVIVQYEISADFRYMIISGLIMADPNYKVGYSGRVFQDRVIVPIPEKSFTAASDFIKYITMYDMKDLYPKGTLLWETDTSIEELSRKPTLLDYLDTDNDCILRTTHEDLTNTISNIHYNERWKICLFID